MGFWHKAQKAGKQAAQGINFLVLVFCFALPHFACTHFEQVGWIQFCSEFFKDFFLEKPLYSKVSYQGEPISVKITYSLSLQPDFLTFVHTMHF